MVIIAAKIILTLVFLGICITACCMDPRDPGPEYLWLGNNSFRRAFLDKNGDLKKHIKPIFVLIVFVLFGSGILVIWSAP